MVVVADGDDQGERGGAVQQVLADLAGVPGGAQDVVEADDQGGDGRALVERFGELVAAYVGNGGAMDGELAEPHVVVHRDRVGQDPRPAAPSGRVGSPTPQEAESPSATNRT